jgi:hypothetical protein
MHPADVAAFVADRADDLRQEIARYPELGVTRVSIEDSVQLYITFTKEDHQVVQQAVLSGMFGARGEQLGRVFEVPLIGARKATRELILHMDCTDFDSVPPSANLLLPDRTQLPDDQWPAMGPGGIIRGHRDYNRPFFCRRGLREYHSHVQHEDDPWDRYREGLSLSAITLDLLNGLRYRWGGKL